MKASCKLGVILIGLALAGCGGAPIKTYTSTAGNFRANMPGEPTVTSQQVGTPLGPITMNTVTANGGGQVSYNVIYADYPAGTTKKDNVDNVLEGACNGAVAAAKLTQTGRKPISLDGHPGREVQFQLPNASQGGGYLRVFCVGDRLYQVLITGPTANATPERCAAFLDSFKFVEKKPSVLD